MHREMQVESPLSRGEGLLPRAAAAFGLRGRSEPADIVPVTPADLRRGSPPLTTVEEKTGMGDVRRPKGSRTKARATKAHLYFVPATTLRAQPQKEQPTPSQNGSRDEIPCGMQGQRPCPPEAPRRAVSITAPLRLRWLFLRNRGFRERRVGMASADAGPPAGRGLRSPFHPP